jgi:dual specificity tyrosine-phosphorylation-regulated kinase 2/3/4
MCHRACACLTPVLSLPPPSATLCLCCTQGAIEIAILEHLKEKDHSDKHNVIHMHDHFVFRNHLCVTFEMLAGDLYAELKKNGFCGLSSERVRAAASDLVQCLRNLRRSRIVHCDLKPENIMLKPGGAGLKVIDFGSSCFVSERVHTYIQSRFYRAPEIVLGGEYSTPIDMWSLGCMLVELATGKPLFPAASEKELIAMQVEVLGMPDRNTIVSGSRSHHYFTADFRLRPVVDRKGRTRGVTQRQLPAELMTESNRTLRDFVMRCLR